MIRLEVIKAKISIPSESISVKGGSICISGKMMPFKVKEFIIVAVTKIWKVLLSCYDFLACGIQLFPWRQCICFFG